MRNCFFFCRPWMFWGSKLSTLKRTVLDRGLAKGQ